MVSVLLYSHHKFGSGVNRPAYGFSNRNSNCTDCIRELAKPANSTKKEGNVLFRTTIPTAGLDRHRICRIKSVVVGRGQET